ncbi:hypothetical protein J4N46_02585 [Capnocytophaga sp. Marseille-Q4570]|jgi:DNA-damage-inducible protein D family protein|uniref:DNA-damage-inducible protein D n=1 Tax=Capnocytophaga bilenii TaxID=2819369 RepID=A0ABS3PVG5_9FLAO|nr:hypothetical protein [Capnocytophaga bilenii]MBO1883334.1 hypothetical protein [Capnocytophaga bilenii]
MKTDEIKDLFKKFEEAAQQIEDIECWSARELQTLLGYAQWRNFELIIQKAKVTCEGAGEKVAYHFADVSKMITLAKGAERQIDDILLMLIDRGITPEKLPPAEDIKKVQRKLSTEEKKLLNNR